MSKSIRPSKVRHVFGTQQKRDKCYENIRITQSVVDGTFCSANGKFVAICMAAGGGGKFIVIPLEKTGRVEQNHPVVCGHGGEVLDVKWCPHNDNMIASSSEDCTIKVWEIPDGGLSANLSEPLLELDHHTKRVHIIHWYPTVENVLLSVGMDNMVVLWDLDSGEALWEAPFPDLVFSASFNYDGSRFAVTCKNKKIYVCDARTGKIISEGEGHEGSKPSHVVYLKNEKLLTTGCSKMSERQLALWDTIWNLNALTVKQHSSKKTKPSVTA